MKKVKAPWIPALWEEADVRAIQALAQGNASESQQRHALRYIVEALCATYDNPFKPDSERDTSFACGMQFVGQRIVTLTKMNVNQIKAAKAQ
jgi:hypothetical protein